MENLNRIVADAPRIPVKNVSYQEKNLLDRYMPIDDSLSDCYDCNGCGSGDCNSCCEAGH